MVLVPGSGLIGNLAVVACLLLLVVLMGRSFLRTARRNGREDGDDPR